MPSLLEQIAAAKRRGIRSAPQNAVLSHAAQGFQTQGFQNHIPARGRKRSFDQILSKTKRNISKPHPRKGTETFLSGRCLFNNSFISKPHPRKGTETDESFLDRV